MAIQFQAEIKFFQYTHANFTVFSHNDTAVNGRMSAITDIVFKIFLYLLRYTNCCCNMTFPWRKKITSQLTGNKLAVETKSVHTIGILMSLLLFVSKHIWLFVLHCAKAKEHVWFVKYELCFVNLHNNHLKKVEFLNGFEINKCAAA